jgi:hypothetical protein
VWAVLDLYITHATNGIRFTQLERQRLRRLRYTGSDQPIPEEVSAAQTDRTGNQRRGEVTPAQGRDQALGTDTCFQAQVKWPGVLTLASAPAAEGSLLGVGRCEASLRSPIGGGGASPRHDARAADRGHGPRPPRPGREPALAQRHAPERFVDSGAVHGGCR